MPLTDVNEWLLLPPRTRLLHIGPMKTGTTSVQAAASARRDVLRQHGVCYPGQLFNHRRQLGALMGWSVDTWKRTGELRPDLLDVDRAGVPPQTEWTQLRAELAADPERRVFLTHEFVSQADDATARRIVAAIGGPVHICITLRAPGSIVPSLWTQSITDDAQTQPYEPWIRRFFGVEGADPLPGRYQRAYDQGALVNRWADIVGADQVTVVVVDQSDPSLLTSAFEAMLGLPAQTLEWRLSNRSLTAVDAELFRHVNVILRDRRADWTTFYDLVWKGAIRLGPSRRKSRADELRVRLPAWAAARAAADGRRYVEEIERSAVRVVGDLGRIAVEPSAAEWRDLEEVPIEIAADAVAAAILAGQEQRKALRKKIKAQAAELAALRRPAGAIGNGSSSTDPRDLARRYGTRQLLAAATHRVRDRMLASRPD